ncbi:MAG: aminotransferase class I/II-fold pyridoxal phosphate-dependent enzyme [Anaerolineae bacterium]
MDIFEKIKGFTRAKEAMRGGYYPYFRALDHTEGTTVTVDGKTLIMVGSNNYVGLTTHPRVRQAAIEAIEKYGTGCTGSRFLNGTLKLHQELDRRLAEYIGKPAALCFSTGYQTNLGTISALVGRRDVAVVDKEDHASIVDGCRFSLGTVKRFRHNDMDHLKYVLEQVKDADGILVIVDGVYSMEGDIAPLPQIVELCKRYGARLMVDDAHALGVLGGGRGTAAHFGLVDEVDLIMGTFSKSFASIGGVIAGDEDVIHYIQHHARPMIFSASMAPPNVATVLACLDVLESEPQWIERLWENTRYMHAGFKRLGFNTGNSQTPIIPIIIGDDFRTVGLWMGLWEEGVYTNPVLEPAVSPGGQRLRTSYMATHTREQLDKVLQAFEVVGKRTGFIS